MIDLAKIQKLSLYVNGDKVNFVGIVDVIIEAEKPVKIQVLRENEMLEPVIEEYEPRKATIDTSYSGETTLRLTVGLSKKKVIKNAKLPV